MNHPQARSIQIRDIHALYDVVDQHGAGLPMPSVGREGRAVFYFSQIKHSEDAQQGMRVSEATLTRYLDFEIGFEDRPVEVAGSAAYWIRTAYMRSGLAVDLVALAAHKPSEGKPALHLVGAA